MIFTLDLAGTKSKTDKTDGASQASDLLAHNQKLLLELKTSMFTAALAATLLTAGESGAERASIRGKNSVGGKLVPQLRSCLVPSDIGSANSTTLIQPAPVPSQIRLLFARGSWRSRP